MKLFLGGAKDDPLLAEIRRGLHAAGVEVHVVSLEPSLGDDAAHEARFISALGTEERPTIGGYSLGARIAVRVAARVQARAVLCFGYPFHRAGDPGARHGFDALSQLDVPTRIIQGTRDSHGSEADVRGYELPSAVEVTWLRDGNHRFVPRARTGTTQEALMAAALSSSLAFLTAR